MAIDERFEARLAGALRAYLDPALGPDMRWDGSPAARRVQTMMPRRTGRTWLLVAAVVGVLLVVGGLIAVGGLTRRSAPTPSTSPSQPAVVALPSPTSTSPSTTPTSTPGPCITEWSFKGTASPRGLADGIRIDQLYGDGSLVMEFGHSLDTVRSISITPTEPPFVNSAGTTVTVRGRAFYKLTVAGLTRRTQVPDNIGRQAAGRFGHTVQSPIAALRRIQSPDGRRPVDGPGPHSTEVWIIGLDRAECLAVTTRDLNRWGYEPGDDAIVVVFEPAPSA